MKGNDPAVERLLDEVRRAMRGMEDIIGSSFNDLDITIDNDHTVTGLVVSVHHKHNFEYGVTMPIAMAMKLSPEAVAAYFYGSGAAQYQAERVPHS